MSIYETKYLVKYCPEIFCCTEGQYSAPKNPNFEINWMCLCRNEACNLNAFSREKRDSTRPIFFYDPVVVELICCRSRANRQINDSNTTGRLKKIGRDHCYESIYLREGREKSQTHSDGFHPVVSLCLPPFFGAIYSKVLSLSSVIKQEMKMKKKDALACWESMHVSIGNKKGKMSGSRTGFFKYLSGVYTSNLFYIF